MYDIRSATEVKLDFEIADRCRVGFAPIGNVGFAFWIWYQDIPLWLTAEPEYPFEVWLAQGQDDEPHTLMCRDSYGDIWTYGDWRTLDEALEWLDKPNPLY